MNKKEFERVILEKLKDTGKRKHVCVPKQRFTITDSDGVSRDFTVKQNHKTVSYTAEDVGAVVDAFIETVKEAITRGESVKIGGFGEFKIKRYGERVLKIPGKPEPVLVEKRFVPRFKFGNELRVCAKVFGMTTDDQNAVPFDESYFDDEEGDEDQCQ